MSTTPALRRKDSPARLELGEEDLVNRSAAILQAAGYRLIPLARPIGPWQLLATCSQGLLLCCVVREACPETMGAVLGPPPGWPVNLRRLVHRWTDKPLPETLSCRRNRLARAHHRAGTGPRQRTYG